MIDGLFVLSQFRDLVLLDSEMKGNGLDGDHHLSTLQFGSVLR